MGTPGGAPEGSASAFVMRAHHAGEGDLEYLSCVRP